MHNPWIDLPEEAPYLLPADTAVVTAFNRKAADAHRIHAELLPEPFLGLPDAPVVLLNLNPGYSEEDAPFYENQLLRDLWRKNLLHAKMDYQFYLLHPAFACVSGPRWWAQKLREPIDQFGREAVARNFCCVEYFPYHSQHFRPLDVILESQCYSFELVRKSLQTGSLIIVMRGEKLWQKAVPELKHYPRLFRLRSVQNVAVSRNNCPDGFPLIEEALLKHKEPA